MKKVVRTIIEGQYPEGNWKLTIVGKNNETLFDMAVDGNIIYGIYPIDVLDLDSIIEVID